MQYSRRDITRMLLAGGAAAALPAPLALATRRSDNTLFDWKRVGPGAHVAFSQGGNAMVVVSGDEAMLIDSKNAGFGAILRREAGVFGHRVTRLVNTHHHADHTGGNDAFSGDLPVLAHRRAVPRIEEQVGRYAQSIRAAARSLRDAGSDLPTPAARDLEEALEQADELTPADFAPTETMTDHRTIHLGDLIVELHHAGPGHTDNDVFIFIPELNLLHTGDLLFNGLHPYIDIGAGATTAGWERSLLAMRRMINADTTVVPGHGEITDSAGLLAQRDYFETVRGVVARARAQDMTRDEVTALPAPPALADHAFERMWPRNLGVIFDELAAD